MSAPFIFVHPATANVQLTRSQLITWDSANAVSVTCDQDLGAILAGDPLPLSGSQSVTPIGNITYTFTATSADTSTATATSTITSVAFIPLLTAPICVERHSATVRKHLKATVRS